MSNCYVIRLFKLRYCRTSCLGKQDGILFGIIFRSLTLTLSYYYSTPFEFLLRLFHAMSVGVCSCRDISRVLTYYVDILLLQYFIRFFCMGLLPRFQSPHFTHYRQLLQY